MMIRKDLRGVRIAERILKLSDGRKFYLHHTLQGLFEGTISDSANLLSFRLKALGKKKRIKKENSRNPYKMLSLSYDSQPQNRRLLSLTYK